MNYTIFLAMLGIEESNFENRITEPIKVENGYMLEVYEHSKERECPKCKISKSYIQAHYYSKINYSLSNYVCLTLRIRRVRFKCLSCNTTFTKELKGISRYATTSESVKRQISNDFFEKLSFTQIAKKYNVSVTYIINLFDELVKRVPRGSLGTILCIDEFHFSKEMDQKYCCVLVDYETKLPIDIVKNRQMSYLKEYFSLIPLNERNKVKIFISDMYDAYETIRRIYFPHAIHIVDLFHVTNQLTTTINRIRTNVMNNIAGKGSKEYNFMKGHWKHFICRKSKVPDKIYKHSKTGKEYTYFEMIQHSLHLSNIFWDSYNILQEFYGYSRYETFEDASNFIDRMVNKLENTKSDLLLATAKTYRKWKTEIANCFSHKETGKYFTNAITENMNTHIKGIIKLGYGYTNYKRFRNRCLLILRTAKQLSK